MTIDYQTKIGDLLEAYPQLEDTLLSLSPAFAKLRNPVLRRTVGRVATIGQAAKIAGISPAVMIQTLRNAAGLTSEAFTSANEEDIDEQQPEWFDETKITTYFDAHPIIEAGGSPMSEVIRLSKALEEGKIMELIVPFRPEPLMDILKSKGFKVWYNGRCYIMK